ncbi:hypothetical protein GCM10011579_084080 [Streptomyces albiflavescens]|uniref:Uncharacterized protein n=1 Tax=Streptomyces albiflavescens TaxID=1623582 RepID=A0A917YDS6_9ACTN|nr:hypothetical protein [Streptomyces albiflavescens]GGN89320.1 hypothetical protein GCM10011579_084080 [Streptomyces albiflavescens]
MSRWTQHRPRGARQNTPLTVFCAALTVLFAAVVLCLGPMAHTGVAGTAAAPMATMSTTEQPAQKQTVAVTHQADCPVGDVCCGLAIHAVRAVPVAPAQPLPATLPCIPSLPRPHDTSCSAHSPPTGGAPDLHVLQVQRT